jgi:hypothetical protein
MRKVFRYSAGLEQRSLNEVMQEHPCKTLAYYLVSLGFKLGFINQQRCGTFLGHAAYKKWNKEVLFS